MATNPPKGDGHRNGAVRDRSQTYNPKNDRWTKRDSDSGRFMDQKADSKPFKGVRKENYERPPQKGGYFFRRQKCRSRKYSSISC